MKKVITIIGTRPELIRLSRTIDLLDRVCVHKLVHTGQNFDSNLKDVFFSELGIRRPDYAFDGGSVDAVSSIAYVLMRTNEVLMEEKPDAVLILGDTNSSLSAIAAKKHKIPIFHIEAGNRCFDERVPEEVNRRIVDHIADFNITYSEIARQYLLREGISPQNVVRIGSPLHEVLSFYNNQIEGSDVLKRVGLEPNRFLLVSMHRQENVDDSERLFALLANLQYASKQLGIPAVMSTHPRLRSRLAPDADRMFPNILFHEPFSFFDYIKMQKNAYCVISDSGSISEEAEILGIPAVNFRTTHERPESDTKAVTILASLGEGTLTDAIILSRNTRGSAKPLDDYFCPDFSRILVRLLLSRIDYVNYYTWRK